MIFGFLVAVGVSQIVFAGTQLSRNRDSSGIPVLTAAVSASNKTAKSDDRNCDVRCWDSSIEFPERSESKLSSNFAGEFFAGNEKCKRHLIETLRGLENGDSWAIEMIDASSKIPNGLVTGNGYQFGNYDQCVDVRSPDDEIKGKYCLVNVEFAGQQRDERSLSKSTFQSDYDIYGTVFEKFKANNDFTKKNINSFNSGLCIPDTCRGKDAETLLRIILRSTSKNDVDRDVRIKAYDLHCSTGESKKLSKEAIILGSFILALFLWVIFCTIWDRTSSLESEKEGKFYFYLRAFSLSRNISKFADETPERDMNIFDGMKCLSMFLVIMGHRGMASLGGPLLNPQFLEERYKKAQNIFLLNGTLIVDTFFLISGYLTFLSLFKECKIKGKKLNFLYVYAYRWLRIMPVYMLIIFFYAYLLEYMGTGPFWAAKVSREAERCRKNWWTNFFFLNNYWNTESLCMFQSWYVTCDMHFTLLAPFIVTLIAKSPKKGLVLLVLLIVGSVLGTFGIVYYNKYDGVLRVYINTFEDLATNFTFNKVYIKTHHRGTPYFWGMAAAYLYLKLKKVRHRFSKRHVWIYSILATVSALSAICGAWVFYIPGRRYDALENALYAGFHRLFWAFSMSWIALAGGTKALGILEPILSNNIFKPFSKLSYSTFLVHGAVQLYTTSTLRVPEYMNFTKLYWMTCGDIILSLAIAYFLHIFFEAPIKCITHSLFPPRIKKSEK